MSIHEDLNEAIRSAREALDEAIRIINLEKDSPEDDEAVFETAGGFMENLLETSDVADQLITTPSVRAALELIREAS